jgi:excisionase family DNA binding protein
MSAPALEGLEPLLTARDVAQLLRCSVSEVYKLRRTGALPAIPVGALLRFNPEVVRAYMRGEPLPRGPRLVR